MVTKKTTRPSINSVAGRFLHWLEVGDEAAASGERKTTIRDSLIEWVLSHGKKDAEGHYWYELSEEITFKDRKGKVRVFDRLKAERHLTPSEPVPDEDLAEQWLRDHNLWLKEKDAKLLADLQTRNPNVIIDVRVDIDAVAALYWKGNIPEEEYEGLLGEQQEVYHFKPQEA